MLKGVREPKYLTAWMSSSVGSCGAGFIMDTVLRCTGVDRSMCCKVALTRQFVDAEIPWQHPTPSAHASFLCVFPSKKSPVSACQGSKALQPYVFKWKKKFLYSQLIKNPTQTPQCDNFFLNWLPNNSLWKTPHSHRRVIWHVMDLSPEISGCRSWAALQTN